MTRGRACAAGPSWPNVHSGSLMQFSDSHGRPRTHRLRPSRYRRGIHPKSSATPTPVADQAAPPSPTGFPPRAGGRSPRPPGPSPGGTAHTPAADHAPGSGGSSSDRTARTPTRAARRTTSRPTDADRQQAAARSSRRRLEQIIPAPLADAGLAAGQIGADGLTVTAQMAGDRRDRPPLPVQRMHVDVVLPCQHEQQEPLRKLVRGQRPPASKGFRQSRRSHTGGEFQ